MQMNSGMKGLHPSEHLRALIRVISEPRLNKILINQMYGKQEQGYCDKDNRGNRRI